MRHIATRASLWLVVRAKGSGAELVSPPHKISSHRAAHIAQCRIIGVRDETTTRSAVGYRCDSCGSPALAEYRVARSAIRAQPHSRRHKAASLLVACLHLGQRRPAAFEHGAACSRASSITLAPGGSPHSHSYKDAPLRSWMQSCDFRWACDDVNSLAQAVLHLSQPRWQLLQHLLAVLLTARELMPVTQALRHISQS